MSTQRTSNKIIKSVSFNETNPNEKEMLSYFSRRNFSKYVKTLIKQDMENKKATEVTKNKKQKEDTILIGLQEFGEWSELIGYFKTRGITPQYAQSSVEKIDKIIDVFNEE